jgi:hypothetical protein
MARKTLSATMANLRRPQKLGRRTIDDATLIQHRNTLLTLLGAHWAEFAWELGKVRNVEEITSALKPFVGKYGSNLVRFLVKPSVVDPGLTKIRKTRGELSAAAIAAQNSFEAFNRQREQCNQTRTFMDRVSQAETGKSSKSKKVDLESPDLQQVRKEDALRRKELEKVEEALCDADKHRDCLAERLAVEESGFAQAELFDFISGNRYAFTPENLAKAIAGLPEISWRQSFLRCSTLLKDSRFSHMVKPGVHPNYDVFMALDYIFKSPYPSEVNNALQLLETGLASASLPKRLKPGRDILKENWSCLLEAVQVCCENLPSHKDITPFLLTAEFTKSYNRPKGLLDCILSHNSRGRTR